MMNYLATSTEFTYIASVYTFGFLLGFIVKWVLTKRDTHI